MGAIASKYQTDPWQPNVDKSSKDSSDQQKAADAYNKIYGGSPTYGKSDDQNKDPGPIVNRPELAMAYTTAPDLVPTTPAPPPPSNGSSLTNADYTAFSADLGALLTAEQAFLNATQTARNGYEDLRNKVNDAINNGTLFGQNVGHWKWPTSNHNENEMGNDTPSWSTDALDKESIQFAQAINPMMSQKMQDIAGLIETVGMFTAMLNNTGQLYTETDANSVFPESQLEIAAGVLNVFLNNFPMHH